MKDAEYSNPLNADDVMAIFRRHGIKGNPGLKLEEKGRLPVSGACATAQRAADTT